MKKRIDERFIDAIEKGMNPGRRWEYEHKFWMAEEPLLKRFWTVFVYKISDSVGMADVIARSPSVIVSIMVSWILYCVLFLVCGPIIIVWSMYAFYKGIREILIARSIRRNPRYLGLRARYEQMERDEK